MKSFFFFLYFTVGGGVRHAHSGACQHDETGENPCCVYQYSVWYVSPTEPWQQWWYMYNHVSQEWINL